MSSLEAFRPLLSGAPDIYTTWSISADRNAHSVHKFTCFYDECKFIVNKLKIYNIWWIDQTKLAYFMVYLILNCYRLQLRGEKEKTLTLYPNTSFIAMSWSNLFFYCIGRRRCHHRRRRRRRRLLICRFKLRAWINSFRTKCKRCIENGVHVVSLILSSNMCVFVLWVRARPLYSG